jgi:hypothetical protein
MLGRKGSTLSTELRAVLERHLNYSNKVSLGFEGFHIGFIQVLIGSSGVLIRFHKKNEKRFSRAQPGCWDERATKRDSGIGSKIVECLSYCA